MKLELGLSLGVVCMLCIYEVNSQLYKKRLDYPFVNAFVLLNELLSLLLAGYLQ